MNDLMIQQYFGTLLERIEALEAGGGGGGGAPPMAPMVPMLPEAGRYVGNLLSGTLTTGASAANREEAGPFLSGRELVIDQVGISISTLSAGNACVVVYDADADGRPTAVLAQSPNMDTGTTGTKLASLSFTFAAGKLYYLSVWTSASPTRRTGQTYARQPLSWTNAATPVRQHVLRRTATYGTAAAWVYAGAQHTSANMPLVLLRVAP